MKRIIIFLAITFSITWAYEFLVVYPLVDSDLSAQTSTVATLSIAVVMFFPAIGVALTRLITREGFKNCFIKPYPLKRSLPWFAVAWFGPAILISIGAIIYFLIFPGDFDPSASAFEDSMTELMATSGESIDLPVSIVTIGLVQIVIGIFLGPALNIFTTFGEEWGWRGYLMPKMAQRMRITPTLLLSGVIWGLWHAPITALGHNYGLGYPGWPITGILAMCVLCIVAGIFLSYVTIRTGSCLAAAISHGSLNSLASAPVMFAIAGTSPFIGPLPTGIIGGCAFIAVAVWMLLDLRKRERNGELNIPIAGA